MKILVAGAGAMGARFGFMLKDAGNDVTFVDKWEEHVKQINQEGLKVVKGNDVLTYNIPTFFPENLHDSFELILVFTKTMQLTGMMEAIKSNITEQTHIVCLLNGLGNIEVLEKFVPRNQIYVGTTIWSSELCGPGKIEVTGSGSIELQQVEASNNNALDSILTTFNNAHLNAKKSNDVFKTIWHKVAFNSVLNTYCALLECNVGEFGSYPEVDVLINAVLNEAVAVGTAEKVAIQKDEIFATIHKQFNPDGTADHYPSMYQDLHKKRLTEIDYLNGMIATLGKKHQIATPTCTLLTHMIHAKENMNIM